MFIQHAGVFFQQFVHVGELTSTAFHRTTTANSASMEAVFSSLCNSDLYCIDAFSL